MVLELARSSLGLIEGFRIYTLHAKGLSNNIKLKLVQ